MIDVVSAARSEFNHCLAICEALKKIDVDVRLILTGSHGHESTQNQSLISEASFKVLNLTTDLDKGDLSQNSSELAKMNTLFGELWSKEPPKCVLFVGDRYEILAPATIAVLANIPIAHAYGGECDISYCIDTRVRNALTSLSHIHFVAHEEIKNRIIRLGEEAWRIKVVGNVAINNSHTDCTTYFHNFLTEINFDKNKPIIAACYLPSTSLSGTVESELNELLFALSSFTDYNFIWAGVNSDPGSEYISKVLKNFCLNNSNHYFSEGLGQKRFNGLLQTAQALVGNSSSGFLEAASFKLPVVNIGTRQSGRLSGENVISVPAKSELITEALDKVLSHDYQVNRQSITNPFYTKDSAMLLATYLKEFLALDEQEIFIKRYVQNNPSKIGNLLRCKE